mmetsp:Transcript_12112/g.20684  ORF Transcript_12112/g.20684 Transcript_12112/m.20684 type:complete len:171 (-) Transcript_12112:72-584(-)
MESRWAVGVYRSLLKYGRAMRVTSDPVLQGTTSASTRPSNPHSRPESNTPNQPTKVGSAAPGNQAQSSAINREQEKQWCYASCRQVLYAALESKSHRKNKSTTMNDKERNLMNEYRLLVEAMMENQQALRDNRIGLEVDERERLKVNARRVGLHHPAFSDEEDHPLKKYF